MRCYGMDRLGRLAVGPQSAGAEPGPAAFGKGGVEATVSDADIALGYSALVAENEPPPLITASLTIDYAGAARLGDWIEIHSDIQKVGRTMAFANCYFLVDDKRIARASAVFSVARA